MRAQPISRRCFDEALGEAARRGAGLDVAPDRLAHGLAAAKLVRDTEGDIELAIATVVHEACEGAIDDRRLTALRDLYGERVARVVAWCSENGTHPLPPFRDLDEFRVAELLCAHRDVLIVAAADTVAALRALTATLAGGSIPALASPMTVRAALWFFGEAEAVFGDRLRGHALAAEAKTATCEFRRVALNRLLPLSAAG